MNRLRNDIKVASVRNIVRIWYASGINGVKDFLNDESTKIFEGSWAEKIKNLLKEEKFKSTEQEISLVAFNLNMHLKNGKEKGNNSK